MPSSALDHVMAFLQSVASQLASRLTQILAILRENQASAGLATIAAFAISIIFAWRFSRDGTRQRRRKPPHNEPQPGTAEHPLLGDGASTSASGGLSSGTSSASSSSAHSQHAQGKQAAALTPLASCVRRHLAGAQRVTCHILGVLLRQETPGDLAEGATLIPSAAEVILEVARHADLYLMAQVEDDAGEVAILSALEDGGVLGPKSPFNSCKLLFCSTETGIMSFVRQLEPDLHIEGIPNIVDQLKRFTKRQLQVSRSTGQVASGAPNVTNTPSLEVFFEVPQTLQ